MLPDGLHGELTIVSPSGRSMTVGHPHDHPLACLEIKSWKVLGRALQRGANGFAESYMRGEIEVESKVDQYPPRYLPPQNKTPNIGG